MKLSLFARSISDHKAVIESIAPLERAIELVSQLCADALRKGGKIVFCGNGGSAADSQHLVAELVGRLKGNRRSLAALALGTDGAVLTCIGNDFGYDEIYSRQVEGLCQKNDVLFGLSTSGNSRNVIRAIETGNELGLTTVGLLGGDGGRLGSLCSHSICISTTTDTARIQEAHMLIGHILCGAIESQLNLGGDDGR